MRVLPYPEAKAGVSRVISQGFFGLFRIYWAPVHFFKGGDLQKTWQRILKVPPRVWCSSSLISLATACLWLRDWPRQWCGRWGLARRHQERDTIAGRSLASAPSAPWNGVDVGYRRFPG